VTDHREVRQDDLLESGRATIDAALRGDACRCSANGGPATLSADEFVALAHDLKSPLTILTGYIDLLLTGQVGELKEAQRQVLLEAQASGRNLRNCVSDFLLYTSARLNLLELSLETADLNECLEEMAGIWRPKFQKNRVALLLLRGDPLSPLLLDRHKLEHAVSILLDNALRFTPPGGSVWLKAQPHWWERRLAPRQISHLERRRREERAANSILLTVTDTGPGIPPEYHEDVFQAPEPGARKRNRNGLGIGLALARHIILAHHGKIWVESGPEGGCRLCVVLPMQSSLHQGK
jgi:signal transduction histidine kinase